LNPTDDGSLTSEYARNPITKRATVLDVPQYSLIFRPLGLKVQRLSRSVSGPLSDMGPLERLDSSAALGSVGTELTPHGGVFRVVRSVSRKASAAHRDGECVTQEGS
jgi:hypothetical protein